MAISRIVLLSDLACGERYSLLDLHAELRRILNVEVAPVFGPARKGDVKHSLAAIELATERLGYVPSTKWADGLQRTAVCYRAEVQDGR